MAQGDVKQKTIGVSGFVFPDAQVIVFAPPKAARTSIMHTFADAYAVNTKEKWKEVAHRFKDRGDGGLSNYFKIGICRSPWVRMQSIYVDKMLERPRPNARLLARGFYHAMPFPMFIKMACAIPDEITEKHLRSQWMTLLRRGKLDLLIKFEELEDGWGTICKMFMERAGKELPPLYHLNATKSIKPRWTSHLLDLIEERYKKDIALFGYKRP